MAEIKGSDYHNTKIYYLNKTSHGFASLLLSIIGIMICQLPSINGQYNYKEDVEAAYTEIYKGDVNEASEAASRLLEYYDSSNAIENIKNSSIPDKYKEQFKRLHVNLVAIGDKSLDIRTASKQGHIETLTELVFRRESADKESELQLDLLPVGAIVTSQSAYTKLEMVLFSILLGIFITYAILSTIYTLMWAYRYAKL